MCQAPCCEEARVAYRFHVLRCAVSPLGQVIDQLAAGIDVASYLVLHSPWAGREGVRIRFQCSSCEHLESGRFVTATATCMLRHSVLVQLRKWRTSQVQCSHCLAMARSAIPPHPSYARSAY